MCVHLAWVDRAPFAHEFQEQLRALSTAGGPARGEAAWVHQRIDRLRHEAVVDEMILLDAERRVPAFQVAGPVVFDAMPQRQILGARGRADRIGLQETEPFQRAFERGRTEQTAGDGKMPEIVEGDGLFYARSSPRTILELRCMAHRVSWTSPTCFTAGKAAIRRRSTN
jgi:hypothetical protein